MLARYSPHIGYWMGQGRGQYYRTLVGGPTYNRAANHPPRVDGTGEIAVTRRKMWLDLCVINTTITMIKTEITGLVVDGPAATVHRMEYLERARHQHYVALEAIGYHDVPLPHVQEGRYHYYILDCAPSAHTEGEGANQYEITYMLGAAPVWVSSVWVEVPPSTTLVAPLRWNIYDSVDKYYTPECGWIVDRIYYSADGKYYSNADVVDGIIVGGPVFALYVQLGVRGYTYTLHSRVRFGRPQCAWAADTAGPTPDNSSAPSGGTSLADL